MTIGPGFAPIRRIDDREPVVSILTSSRPLPGGEWHGGVSWRSPAALSGHVRPYCNTDDAEDAGVLTQPEFYPYTIYVPYACDWVTGPTEYRDEALSALEAVTAWTIARSIWAGTSGSPDSPTLQSEAVDESAADPVHPVTALGTLLEAYEDCSQAGGAVVHAPTAAIVSLLSHGVIRQNGDHYVGPNGTIVSPGPGYPTGATGTGPDGADAGAGNVYMYVTGPVEVAMDPAAIPLSIDEAGFDRRTNRYEFTAQRMAIHRFDPACVFAVLAYVPSPGAGEST